MKHRQPRRADWRKLPAKRMIKAFDQNGAEPDDIIFTFTFVPEEEREEYRKKVDRAIIEYYARLCDVSTEKLTESVYRHTITFTPGLAEKVRKSAEFVPTIVDCEDDAHY